PDDGPLPEYIPPVAQAAEPAAGAIVAPLGTAQKYAGRGRYKGPRNRGGVKYAVLGAFFAALAGGVGAGVYYKPDLFKPLSGGGASVENPGTTQVPGAGPYVPRVTPAASGTFPRR